MKLYGLVIGLIGMSEANGVLDPIARLGAVGILGVALLYSITKTTKANSDVARALTALQAHCTQRNQS